MLEFTQFRQSVGECFYLIIPNDPLLEVKQIIANSQIVEQATKLMLTGEISPEDLLEMVEPVIKDMDGYIEEIEENLVEIYLV